MVLYPLFPVVLFTRRNITQSNKADEIDNMYETQKGKTRILIRNLLAKDFTRCEYEEWIRPALGCDKMQALQV
jgi:hypothetical protein